MKIGLQIPSFTFPGGDAAIRATLAQIVQAAEAGGFYSIWVMDHFFQLEGMLGPADDPMLEGYSTLTYISALTEKVKLGTMVTGVVYRAPGLLVKTATTLDVLSGGRAYFGVGAAWYDREATALGFPFPDTSTRFEWLEETLQIARQMWSGSRMAYKGKHFELAETINSPQVLSQPYPPILIGGTGEKKTLRLVAQYADACNLFTRIGLDGLRHKLDVLRGHCDDIGRDYDSIEKTSLGTIHLAAGQMKSADVIEHCRGLAAHGISHAIFNMPNTHEIAPIEQMAKEVIPAVAEL